MSKTALVTGSSGLIGSEAVRFLDERGWAVHGVDNNMRREFFGEHGDTTWNLERLLRETSRFEHHGLDIRDRDGVERLFARAALRPRLPLRRAAVARPRGLAPVRRLRGERARDAEPARGGARALPRDAVRVHVDEQGLRRRAERAPARRARDALGLRRRRRDGIDESMRIDATMHSLFGASKVAADVMVQEYGRYFGLPTVCFRGGCLTGPHHSARRAARLPRLHRARGPRGPHVPDLRLRRQAGARQRPRRTTSARR